MPCVPLAVEELVMLGAGEAMVRVRVAVPVPVPFVADKVTVEVPDAAGVPEITPVEVFTVKPDGSPVAPKLVGEFDAVIW